MGSKHCREGSVIWERPKKEERSEEGNLAAGVVMETPKGPEFELFEALEMVSGKSCRMTCSDFRWT